MDQIVAYGIALPAAVPAAAPSSPAPAGVSFDAFGLAHVNRLEASVWGAILIIGAALYVNALYD